MASKRRLRRKSCGNKVRHPDSKSAIVARARFRAQGAFMNVYKCKCCGKWHTGHSPYLLRKRSVGKRRG
jgi:hypothetical protein